MYKVNDKNIGEGVGNKRHNFRNLKHSKIILPGKCRRVIQQRKKKLAKFLPTIKSSDFQFVDTTGL